MSEATKFLAEFNRILVDEDGFVDYDKLFDLRMKWRKEAEVECEWSKGALDPDEEYHFNDGSIAYLSNPRQEVFAACAFTGD